MADAIALVWQVWSFLGSDMGMTIGFGLWLISEALASLPNVQANSVFQAVRNFLMRFKDHQPKVAIIFLALALAGCSSYMHSKKCLKPVNGYQACHHVHEYWTEAACTGACK